MRNNYNSQSQMRQYCKDSPILSDQVLLLAVIVIVARVRPRTSKGITDLLLLSFLWFAPTYPSKKSIPTIIHLSIHTGILFSRLESRSLSELTRQITPPTKNGHAPPTTESKKSYHSVYPYSVRAG